MMYRKNPARAFSGSRRNFPGYSNPFGKALFNILTKDNLSESDWEDVEDTLLLADVGAEASEQLVGELRRDARITGKASPDEVRAMLRDNLLDLVIATPTAV